MNNTARISGHFRHDIDDETPIYIWNLPPIGLAFGSRIRPRASQFLCSSMIYSYKKLTWKYTGRLKQFSMRNKEKQVLLYISTYLFITKSEPLNRKNQALPLIEHLNYFYVKVPTVWRQWDYCIPRHLQHENGMLLSLVTHTICWHLSAVCVFSFL